MRRFGAIAAAAALITSLAACAPAADEADAGGTTAGGRGEELVVQFRGAPISLDPALQGTASGSIFTVLAYDSLVYQAPDGSLQPGLATEWEFTDDEHTVFEFTLREGVEFASGEPLTPEAVVASMEYFLTKSGPNMSAVGPVETIEAVDDDTVRIVYGAPFADAPMSLTQTYMFGNVIGPDGVADPASLLQTMDGAGQYVYSPEASVPDSEYVYERNPNYWNPDAQMWDRVKVEIIADPNAVLNAASTGQIDFGLGSSLLAASAEAAGLEIVAAPFYNWGLRLHDVGGEINPALADERVRRAIGLAIDRESIVNALGGEYMAPSDQIVVEGEEGYNPDIGWEYDLDEARELMADAGYQDGFTMTILDSSLQDQQSQIAQAVASALEAIGIEVKLEVDSTSIPSFIEKAESKKFEASLWATNGTLGNAYGDLRGVGSMGNPFGFVDEEMEALYAESLGLDGSERQAIYERMGERWEELAVTIPVLTQYFVNYVGPKVTNVQASAQNPVMLPVGPQPEYNWQPAG